MMQVSSIHIHIRVHRGTPEHTNLNRSRGALWQKPPPAKTGNSKTRDREIKKAGHYRILALSDLLIEIQ
jgi:hypothetical protein